MKPFVKKRTHQRNENLLVDFKLGMPPKELSAKYGICLKYVENILRSFGCKLEKGRRVRKYRVRHCGNSRWFIERNENIYRLYKGGMTKNELSHRFRLDTSYITEIIYEVELMKLPLTIKT